MPGSLVLTMKVALEKGEGLRSSASDESELYLIRPAQLQKCSFYLFWLRAFQTCCLLVNPALLSDLEFDTLLDTFLLHKYNPQCRFFKEFLLLAVAHEKLHLRTCRWNWDVKNFYECVRVVGGNMHFEANGGIKISIYASINLKEGMLALDVNYYTK